MKNMVLSTIDFKEKSKITMNSLYGVDSPLKNNEIKLKVENTCLDRYLSKSPLGSNIIKEKISDTKKERYNDEFYNNREKYKKTCLEKFGFENPMQNDLIKQKLSNIIFERYGVYYPAQNEWLGKMPNRPTHRFIATYNNILSGVIIMSTPNSFSMLLGENTHEIEKLISRGACASWTPKNLASALLMWSIKWMVKNTEFRLFEAYADPEAKELGTIYQACNFYYLGNNFGSGKLYFNPDNPNGWVNNRGFRKLNFYKSYLKKNGIIWKDEWNRKTSILWNKIPSDIVEKMKTYSIECLNNCHVRKPKNKHKYAYVIGKDNRETKILRKKFENINKTYSYPKDR